MAMVPTVSHAAKFLGALAEFRTSAKMRLDAWMNEVTGFGTTRDKTTYGYILPQRLLTDEELSALYHSDDMAARMVDVVPQEMLREGFTIETDEPDTDVIIADKLTAIDVRGNFTDGIRWGRAFGGGATILGCDDGRDANLPLVPERAKDLTYLYTVDRRMLWPATYYEEPGPKMGQPKTFLVTIVGGQHFETAEIHESRLILFGGMPSARREAMEMAGWDMSVYQRAYDILRSFNTGWKAVETLMTDGSQAIFKMTGLADAIGAKGEDLIRARIQVMDLYRSMMRAIVVDADGKEGFERHVAQLAGYPDTLEKFMLRLAATVEMPVTILMGQSPAGMNATGESDFRWFYDRIRSKQNNELAPLIRRVGEVWLATKAGRQAVRTPPKTLAVEFPPLWTETPLAKAQREAAIATRDNAYIQGQVLLPDEVALHRFRPKGFDQEIQLTKEGILARESALKADLERLNAGTPSGEGDEGALDDVAATPDQAVATASLLKLTPSDVAAIVQVNEARASVGLPPLPGPDGKLTLPEFKAKYATLIASVAQAEAGTDPNGELAPPPMKGGFGGGPPGGGPPKQLPPKPADEEKPEPRDPVDELNEAFEKEEDRLDAIHARMREAVRTRLDAKPPRTFYLQRDEDETGVSGTGVVATGCVFPDGKVALRWTTKTASTTLFDNLDEVLKVHGHNGKTRVVYCDDEK